MDLDFLYDLTEELYCLDNGRASIDPVLFFRMQLISYLLLLQWQKQGRFTGRQIVADVTLVKANASMNSLVKREDTDPDARVLKQYEKQYHDFQHGKRKRRVANQTMSVAQTRMPQWYIVKVLRAVLNIRFTIVLM